MAEVANETWPMMPVRVVWGDIDARYETMTELGIDLEFVQEQEYLLRGDPQPAFIDALGRRYRIVVISLEVVLCVLVPLDFTTGDLELLGARTSDTELVVEHLGGKIHRAIKRSLPGVGSFAAVPSEELAALGALIDKGVRYDSPLTWNEFDQIWCDFTDPAPPLSLSEVVRRFIARLAPGRQR